MYGTLTDHGSVSSRFHINAAAGLGDIIGGAIMAVTPAVSRLGGLYYRHKTAKELFLTAKYTPSFNLALLRADDKNFSDLLRQEDQDQNNLIIKKLCELEIVMLSQRQDIYSEEREFAINSFIKSMSAAQAGSLTKITNGIGTIISDYNFSKQTESRLQNIGGTALSYGCGNALATLINIERRVAEERRHKQLLVENGDPGQILAAQIDKLNAFRAGLINGTALNLN